MASQDKVKDMMMDLEVAQENFNENPNNELLKDKFIDIA